MATFSSGATVNADGQLIPMVDAAPTPTPAVEPSAPETVDADVPQDDLSEGEASDATELDESPAEGEPAGDVQPLSGRQRRRQRYEARLVRENEGLRRDLAAQAAHNEYLLRQVSQPGAPAQPQPDQVQPSPTDPPKPNPVQYGSQEEYLDALTDWKLDQRERQRTTQETQQREATARETAQQQWAQREAEGRDTYDDYDEVVSRLSLASTVAPIVADTFRESDVGHALLYYLGQHPKEVQHLNSLAPLAAARWLGQLETRVAPPSAASARRTTPTPGSNGAPPATPPMRPVGTGGAVPIGGFRNGMSLVDYERMRLQERGNRP